MAQNNWFLQDGRSLLVQFAPPASTNSWGSWSRGGDGSAYAAPAIAQVDFAWDRAATYVMPAQGLAGPTLDLTLSTDDVTPSFVGSLAFTSSIVLANDDVTITASATVVSIGSASLLADSVSLTSIGTLGLTGDLSLSVEDASMLSLGTLTEIVIETGVLQFSSEDSGLSGAGVLSILCVASEVAADVVLSGAASISLIGSFTLASEDITFSANAGVLSSNTLVLLADDVQITAVGNLHYVSVLSLTSDGIAMTLFGEVAETCALTVLTDNVLFQALGDLVQILDCTFSMSTDSSGIASDAALELYAGLSLFTDSVQVSFTGVGEVSGIFTKTSEDSSFNAVGVLEELADMSFNADSVIFVGRNVIPKVFATSRNNTPGLWDISDSVDGILIATHHVTGETFQGTVTAFNTLIKTQQEDPLLSPTHLIGVADASNAPPGAVGEYLLVERLASQAVDLVSSETSSILEMSLSAGDWDLLGYFVVTGTGSTAFTSESVSLSLIDATHSLDLVRDTHPSIVPGAVAFHSSHTGLRRVSVISETHIYLVVQAVFTGPGAKAHGTIRARRVR